MKVLAGLLAGLAFATPALADQQEALADAGRDLDHARIAVEEIGRDFARIEAGDWSGTMTIEHGKVFKCGEPSKYPELNCQSYTDAEKAEMRAEMAENLKEAKAELADAEAALKTAENDLPR